MLLEGVTFLKDLLCRESILGYFPLTPPYIYTAVCVINMVTGMREITDLVYPVRAARADCGMLNLARCVNFEGDQCRSRSATASDSVLRWTWRHRASEDESLTVVALALTSERVCKKVANVQSRVAPRAVASHGKYAASRGAVSGSSETRRPHTSMAPSVDACGASRRWTLPAARLAPHLEPMAWGTAGRGTGTPAAGRIRCMKMLAGAHRDPVLPLCSVVLWRIAMGTCYCVGAETCTVAVPVEWHSAAKHAASGCAAGGGRQSPTASATPPER